MDDVAGGYLAVVEDDIFEQVVGGVAVRAGKGGVLGAPVVFAGHEAASTGDGCAGEELETGEFVRLGGFVAEICVHESESWVGGGVDAAA